MNKKFDETTILNELASGSAFFRRREQAAESPTPPAPTPAQPVPTPAPSPRPAPKPPRSSPPDTVIPRHHDTTHDTTTPPDSLLETTRKAVKQIGKEAATHRFTLEEKRALKQIEHTYSQQGIRTSENELTRIAINYILEEYHRNGKTSVLARILDLLNA